MGTTAYGSYAAPVSTAIPLNGRTEENKYTLTDDTWTDLELGSYTGRAIISIANPDIAAADVVVMISTQNTTTRLGIPLSSDNTVATSGSLSLEIECDGTATIYAEWPPGSSGSAPIISVVKLRP